MIRGFFNVQPLNHLSGRKVFDDGRVINKLKQMAHTIQAIKAAGTISMTFGSLGNAHAMRDHMRMPVINGLGIGEHKPNMIQPLHRVRGITHPV